MPFYKGALLHDGRYAALRAGEDVTGEQRGASGCQVVIFDPSTAQWNVVASRPWRAPSVSAASAFASGWAIMSPKGVVVLIQDDAFDEQIYHPDTLIMHGLREIDGHLHAVGLHGARFVRSASGVWVIQDASIFRPEMAGRPANEQIATAAGLPPDAALSGTELVAALQAFATVSALAHCPSSGFSGPMAA